jgi:hypothetical protein
VYSTKPLTVAIVLLLCAAVLCATVCLCEGEIVGQLASSRIVINEFMADNKVTIQSPVGNYTDWIELYNPTDLVVDLGGMFLTDNLTDLKWQFTAEAVIQPHSYLIVWADGNPRLGTPHTNFKLDKEGGALGLIASDGATIIDSVTYDKQIQDVSFGRTVEGGSKWTYLLKPTPGEANVDVSAFFSGYPWHLWVFLSVTIVAVGLVAFRDNWSRRRQP